MPETLPIDPPAKPTTWHRRRVGPIFAASLILAAYLAIDWYRSSTEFAELAMRGNAYTKNILTPYQISFRGKISLRRFPPQQPIPAWATFLHNYVPSFLLPGQSRIYNLFVVEDDAPFLNRVGKAWGTSQFDKIDQLTIRGQSFTNDDFAALRKATSLTKLDLSGTNFSDDELPYLQSPKLEVLILDGTRVNAAGLARMPQFPKLRVISIQNVLIPAESFPRIKARHPNVQLQW